MSDGLHIYNIYNIYVIILTELPLLKLYPFSKGLWVLFYVRQLLKFFCLFFLMGLSLKGENLLSFRANSLLE